MPLTTSCFNCIHCRATIPMRHATGQPSKGFSGFLAKKLIYDEAVVSCSEGLWMLHDGGEKTLKRLPEGPSSKEIFRQAERCERFRTQ